VSVIDRNSIVTSACIEQPVHVPSVDGEGQRHPGVGHLARKARRRASNAHVRGVAEYRAHVLEIVARLSCEHLIDEPARVGVPTTAQIPRQALVAFFSPARSILRRCKGAKHEKKCQTCR
jgi:hypothetical protein